MKGIDPIWLTVISTIVAIDNWIGGGNVSLAHVFPSPWIPWIIGWCGFLGGLLGFVVAALTTLISAKPGILIGAPRPAVKAALAWLIVPLIALVLLLGGAPVHATSLPQAPGATGNTPSYNYPTTKCGLYYGLNTMGSTAAVNGATVGTQFVQGAIGLTLGYTCPIGQGYWFTDADFDFANLNGNANGLSLTGPAKFAQRFGFGAPVDLLISMIPGLSSLQNAVPSLIPLPTGITVNTSSPYIFAAVHEDDVGGQIGLANFKQFLISAGFGIGNKTRLSNGVVFDPYAEYILPSSQVCVGVTGCFKKGDEVLVGMKLEF